jgi:ribosomal protein L9
VLYRKISNIQLRRSGDEESIKFVFANNYGIQWFFQFSSGKAVPDNQRREQQILKERGQQKEKTQELVSYYEQIFQFTPITFIP